MMRDPRNVLLLFYFSISLFLAETLLRLTTTGGFFSAGLLFSFIFSITFAFFFTILCAFFKGKPGHVLSVVLLALAGLGFSSQMVYFRVFKTFYTLYSMGNASQVLEFWKDILLFIAKNIVWIILFFLPAILMAIFGKSLFSTRRGHYRPNMLVLICFMVITHFIGVAFIYFGSHELYSAYDLYYKSSDPILSTQKFGMLTSMRLDLQRLAFGWSASTDSQALDSLSPPLAAVEDGEEPGKATNGENTDVKEEKPIEYNTMDINFDELIANEKNEDVKAMHEYFSKVPPTQKNELTGKYKGYNLILITAEGFSPYAVREDVTPTLYKMVHEGYNFTNFYNPVWGVSTSDGEYVACTGLIPKSGVWSFKKSGSNSMPFVMGNQFKKLDYKTMAYHNHSYTYYGRNISHPNMGYEFKGLGNGLEVKKTWPESDLEMMEKTIPEYINNQPFHTYYMTVSGHMQYTFMGNSMAHKNKAMVENLPYSEPGKAYIASQIELDKAMEYLLNQLEQAGIADKTLIALSADHYPYGLEEDKIDELAGHPVEKNFELYKSTFILYSKGMTPTTIDKPVSSLDIIPTLSNMLGLEYDSRLLMGMDMFSNSEPLVIFSNRSFITDKGRYNAKTKEFTPNEGVQVEEDYAKNISKVINAKFVFSAKILDNDYYSKVLKDQPKQ